MACADAYFGIHGAILPGTTRRVFDDGYQWIVSYHPPDGVAGGDGIIIVSKFSPLVAGIAPGPVSRARLTA